MRPEEVSELSRLFDAALALTPGARAAWLAELEKSQSETVRHLRSMLAQTQATDTALLPQLPELDSDDAVASAGERVGPYKLIREIGLGGMGSVWLADRADGAFKRKVALKLPRLTWAAGLSKRMKRERDIGALLEHPNIARLYDAGVDEHGRPYIAMEYIEAQPIDVYCREHALNLGARLRLFLQVVKAVAYAHGHLVLHRDLKPGNVLVDAGGQAHLLDFGIAKLLDEAANTGTQLTQELGRALTFTYAAPEQIAGKPLAVTADVYSLGVLLYELLTGSLPYRARRDTPGALEEAILAGDAPLASSGITDKSAARALRGDLDAIIGKALKRDPPERYRTADSLAADIQRYLDGQAILARPDSTSYRLRKAVVRHRVPLATATALLAVALVGAGATLLQGRKVAAEAERTRLATAFVSELFRMNALNEPAQGYDSTVTDKPPVDRGIELIEAKFQGQPELQAELYGAVGRVYVELGIDRKATDYANRQLAYLKAQNADKAKVAGALMLLAEAALTAERDADAEGYARQAIALLSVNDTQMPDAMALMARATINQSNRDETLRVLNEGQRILLAQKRAKSVAGAWLKFLQGTLFNVMENKFDAAKPMFDAAIAEAIAADATGLQAAISMQLRIAGSLIARNRPEEGRTYARKAITALEQAGGVNRVRASLANADIQESLFEEGSADFAETMAVLEEASRLLRAPTSGTPPESLAELDFMRAQALMMRGDYESACSLAQASAPIMLQGTQSFGKELWVAASQGDCARNLGDHESADKQLRRTLALRRQYLQGDHPFTARNWANVAINLSMAGRHQEAEAFLAGAPKFENVQGSTLSSHSDVIPETRSRIRMDAGDVEGARALLPETDKHVADAERAVRALDAFYELRGEILCASGDRVSGLIDLRRSIDLQLNYSGPSHPFLARTRAIAGLCSLAQGDRKMAEAFADASRQAFIAQPQVSPYFKEPLKRLERQLGRKAS